MKQRISLLWRGAACLCGVLLLLAGCSPAEAPSQPVGKTNSSTTESSQSVQSSQAPQSASKPEIQSFEDWDGTPFLTLDNYPKMDGSTANLPLMAQVLHKAAGVSMEDAEILSNCSTTPLAWEALARGDVDILLVYEAAESTKSAIDMDRLEITPVGRDALVFINNEGNPVDGLTGQQIVDIYSGRITNWKELGGSDQEIVAYQRDETSGSQSLFAKLVMKDTPLAEAPTELKPAGLGMLIDGLASYRNEGNALGYSVFYYASYMYSQPGLRLMSVDGVFPSDKTIADGSYPYLNDFFVVIRADEPEGSPARLLRDWILSPSGKQTIIDAGYIPV